MDWLKLSQEAFDASTTYVDANLRPDWDYSLKAFRNEHGSGSKYVSSDYVGRSKLFRPKTRSIIRKNEAAAMQAAFSNREMVSVEAHDPTNIINVAGAAALKEVMQYRLTRTIPTFEVYLGGIQDAQVMGAVCSYQYWEYETRKGKKIKDKPCIELRPLENIRLDAGADWLDPVNTSPYLSDIIPMYVCDVKAMMENEDEKTGSPKWKKYDENVIAQAKPDVVNSTRQARLGKTQDPHEQSTGIKSFDIVWVLRWFMKDSQGYDNVFYTLGTEKLLTDPKPIDEVYFHGIRPYVIGCAILETHKALKTSMPTLIRPLQQETNEIANQRIDNVKFVLNKRWLVARGRQVDVQSLVRNVPGGVTLTNDPKNDIVESNWADVTSSAYVEQDRVNADIDDLAGNFSPSTKVANNAVNDTLGGSKLASAGAGMMTDYLIQTVNHTWWSPVLRQLGLLEQHYETDEVILTICGQKAQVFPRYGVSQIRDDLLSQELIVNVEMAMGDPSQKFQKFLVATNAANQVINTAPPGANVKEQVNEIFANAGYRDASRFYNQQADPRLVKSMQMVQHLTELLKGKQMEIQAGLQDTQIKTQSNERIKGAEIQVNAGRISGDLKIREAEVVIAQQQLLLERIRLQIEAAGSEDEKLAKQLEYQSQINEINIRMEEAKTEIAKARMELVGKNMDIAHSLVTQAHERKMMDKEARDNARS